MSALMFTYPVHQVADILFCKATAVPVGKDQLPHLELTRLIARRFNRRYSRTPPCSPSPTRCSATRPPCSATDGQKMSKSRANAIAISATADETARLIAAARTDTERHITYDPVNRPEVSNLVLLAALCERRRPESIASEIGGAGSAALKRRVIEAVNERFRDDPRSTRRAGRRPRLPARGSPCREPAGPGRSPQQTLHDVRTCMHTVYPEQPAHRLLRLGGSPG